MLVLHEVGHVCNLPGHQGAAPNDEVRACLMFSPGSTASAAWSC
jgi:hypothetical protein